MSLQLEQFDLPTETIESLDSRFLRGRLISFESLKMKRGQNLKETTLKIWMVEGEENASLRRVCCLITGMVAVPQTMPILHLSALPSKESVVFQSSSFFAHQGALPTPDEVRHAATGSSSHEVDPWRWYVVRFPSLRLIVKYGRQITIAEGQCLWAMRTLMENTVPVPEVYGWCRDGDSTFLYMELIEAPTLKERWDTLVISEKEEIGKQFGQMVENIGRLELPPSVSFVGHIGGQPIQDIIFTDRLPCPGPFPDVFSFHNYFVKARTPDVEDLEPHEYRPLLPDSAPIKFTHGDLHPTNILVSPEGSPPRIVAIVDWHQSGWFPGYWEYCKAIYSVYYDEWETYVRRAIKEPEGYMGFEWFSLSLI